MDMLSVTGLILAFGAIAVGQTLEGGHLGSLINGSAFVIVIGGTAGAILLQAPKPVFERALRRAPWVLWPPVHSLEDTIGKLLGWSSIARKEGLLGLERFMDNEADAFACKALQLLVDGNEPGDIRHALEMELTLWEDNEYQAVRVFEGMAGYAPTIGIIGSVLGLIHVMENLADPSKLGGGIAAAFVATIYGVGLANLICFPLANKLKSIVQHQSRHSEVIIEGVIAIAQGSNTRTIASRLHGFLQD